MWTTSVSLPRTDEPTQDSSGFVTHVKTLLQGIPASRKDATRDDEMLANQFGYTASCIYEMDKACYNGAGYLIDENTMEIFDIKRTFSGEKSNMISLTCEKRERGKI